MAPKPGRRTSLRLDLSQAAPLESPPGIAALFLIRFDIKKGYVISWQQSIPGIDLEGAVEYKSLPSGLHNVSEDLIYFVHEEYAGICAFINQPATEAERNALMLAVGVLVPLSFGRLGKSWRHAAGLKKLAKQCANNISDTQALTEYWDKHHVRDNEPRLEDTPPDSPAVLRRSLRADRPENLQSRSSISDSTGLETTKPFLAPYHPALSLPDFVENFGPLIFPLYRASLLRKRILIVTEAPVQTSCDYVYALALLSSLPQSLSPFFDQDGAPPLRPRPIFNVGIHDIPFLSTNSDTSSSWIACTTDNVLATKTDLFDILVTLPSTHSPHIPQKAFPKIEIVHRVDAQARAAKLVTLKATQRDARRFVLLRDGLRHLSRAESELDQEMNDNIDDAASTFSSSPIVEPLSWPRLAYTSFLWWASAGEKRTGLSEDEEEQDEQDTSLLPNSGQAQLSHPGLQSNEIEQPREIALIAYFRRLTTLIFTTVADAVARQDAIDESCEILPAGEYRDDPDESDDAEIEGEHFSVEHDTNPLLPTPSNDKAEALPAVSITSTDISEMGLDMWSATDRVFMEELLQVWWGRRADVNGVRIRCCGIPIL
ncbi:hypothetical protein TCE0_017r03833 [Talaromyces pinophilus]|uniref:DUF4484 domain-containing protein n=1 Tax=Talaromyces pinophilus TaxID=128442 RepID=A0A6V8H7G3_TALPI|nr:hypothetical protein TCE0_017r03833 [Talaromyces pinophilus]